MLYQFKVPKITPFGLCYGVSRQYGLPFKKRGLLYTMIFQELSETSSNIFCDIPTGENLELESEAIANIVHSPDDLKTRMETPRTILTPY